MKREDVPSIGAQFESAMALIELSLPKEQRMPEKLREAMRNMFFSGAASVLHAYQHIERIDDDNECVKAIQTIDEEIRAEANKVRGTT